MTDSRAYRGRRHPPNCSCVECVGDSPADWEEGRRADIDDWTGKIISFSVPITGGTMPFRVDRCISIHPATKKPYKYEVSKLIPGGGWDEAGWWTVSQIEELLTRPGAKVTKAQSSRLQQKPKMTKAQSARLERKRVLREMEDRHSLDCSCFQCVTVQDPSVARRNRNRESEQLKRERPQPPRSRSELENERRELEKARRKMARSGPVPETSGRHPITCPCAKCVAGSRAVQIEARLRENERELRESKRREREQRSSRVKLKAGVAILLTGLVAFGVWGAWELLSTSQQDGTVSTPELTVTDNELPPAPVDIVDNEEPPAPPIIAETQAVEDVVRVIKFSHTADSDNQIESIETAVTVWTALDSLLAFEQVSQSETDVELLITFMDLTDLPVEAPESVAYIVRPRDSSNAYDEIVVDTGRISCAREWNEYAVDYLANAIFIAGRYFGLPYHQLPVGEAVAKAAELRRELNDIARTPDEVASLSSGAWTLYHDILRDIDCLNDDLTPAAPMDNLIQVAHSARRFNQIEAFNTALSLWAELNPSIEFEEVDQGGPGVELQISFRDLSERLNYIGLYCPNGCVSDDYRWRDSDRPVGYAEILIDTGKRSCEMEWNEYTINVMANTVAREVSNYLIELGRHPLSWNIPEALSEVDLVDEAEELRETLREIDERLRDLAGEPPETAALRLGDLVSYYDLVAERDVILGDIDCLNNAN